jgi:hypothetical protein
MAFTNTKSCGQHTELASNNVVRVTRCTCGTMHVTLVPNGVTLRMTAEQLRNALTGLKGAIDRIDDEEGSINSSIVN